MLDLWKNGSTKELKIGNKIWIKNVSVKPLSLNLISLKLKSIIN